MMRPGMRTRTVATLLTLAVATPMFAASARAADNFADIRKEIAAQHDQSVKRLQDWIALPSIAAESLNSAAGAERMAQLVRDAGFQKVSVVATDGKPGVFATLDAGAAKTVGLYFMYDVKQYDPKEWTSPPLEARIVDKAGFGKVIVGRRAVNQKGPEAAFLAALHSLRAAGRKLPVNLVLVAEAEERVRNPKWRKRRWEAKSKEWITVKKRTKYLQWVEENEWSDRKEPHNNKGLEGGNTGSQGKTILPNRAVAKIDMRIVPDMKK